MGKRVKKNIDNPFQWVDHRLNKTFNDYNQLDRSSASPNEYFWNNQPYYNFHNEIRITNVVPLLMTMTLMGVNRAQDVTQLSTDLEPPRFHVASSSSLNPDILNSMRSGPFPFVNVEQSPLHQFNQDFPEEISPGPSMELIYAWRTVDFEFESESARDRAIFDSKFIPENIVPLGLEVWHDKIFLTLPRWKTGVPATLATVPRYSKKKSPKLRPYPSWGWHHQESCGGLTSVFRMQVDECDRLWVLDSGAVNLTSSLVQLCPPTIYIFDLKSDRLIRRYQIPEEQVKEDSLWSNIIVDMRNGNCNTARAYVSDVWRFAILVYDFSKDSSFRLQHHFFLPDPLAARYELHGLKFEWIDGILGMSLTPVDIYNDRTLFFHSMSSFREFAVSTSILIDKETATANSESFVPIGKPRAKEYGHSSGSAIDRNGVMFFNMVTRDSIWCWDTRKEYIPQNLGLIGANNETLIFPNDMRIDHEDKQSFWTISNRLPMFLYGKWNPDDINFRLFRSYVDDAVKDTICDPNYIVPESDHSYDEVC